MEIAFARSILYVLTQFLGGNIVSVPPIPNGIMAKDSDSYIDFVNTRLRKFSESATVESVPLDVLDSIDQEWFSSKLPKVYRASRMPKERTTTLAKDLKRLSVMRERMLRGESVYHPGDTLATSDSITRAVYCGSSGGSGSSTTKLARESMPRGIIRGPRRPRTTN